MNDFERPAVPELEDDFEPERWRDKEHVTGWTVEHRLDPDTLRKLAGIASIGEPEA